MFFEASNHPPLVQPLAGTGVVAVRLASARHFARHWHDVHGVGVLLAGGQVSASGCGTVDATAGDIITTNPGEVHDGRPMDDQGRRWAMLYIDPPALASLAGLPDDTAAHLAFTRPVLRDATLRQHLLTLFSLLPNGPTSASMQAPDLAPPGPAMRSLPSCPPLSGLSSSPGLPRSPDLPAAHTLALDAALATVASHLCAAHTSRVTQPATARTGLQDVCERLLADPWQTPSLQALAQPLGISRYQLLRRFTDVHGLPPHAWLRMQRLAQARRLILRGTPLAEVAATCGFADQGHMNRLFAAHYGHTPGQLKPR